MTHAEVATQLELLAQKAAMSLRNITGREQTLLDIIREEKAKVAKLTKEVAELKEQLKRIN